MKCFYLGMMHLWQLFSFQDSSSLLAHLRPKFFHPLDLGSPIWNEHSLRLQMIINQLKANIVQGWLLYVIRSILQVGFRFKNRLINLINWLLFIQLKYHYLIFRGFILLCVQLSKNITKYLLFISIHIFSTHFAINLLYLHNLKM